MTVSDDPAYWDDQAPGFDAEPDHGLLARETRAAWRSCLSRWLPEPPCTVADLGCGTGSLALLAADLGHHVTGVDFAAAMIERARAKAEDAGLHVRFLTGDATRPPLVPGLVDVILVRHLLWALPDAADALAHWAGLLRPGGRFVLIEGAWSTGAGLRPEQVVALVDPHCDDVSMEELTDPVLWGGDIDDVRYVVRGTLRG